MKNKIIIISIIFLIPAGWYSYNIFIQARNIKEAFQFIRESNVEGIENYIQAGNDLHATNKSGWSLLITAVVSEQVEIVDILVNAGVDTNKKARKEQMIALEFADRILSSEHLPDPCKAASAFGLSAAGNCLRKGTAWAKSYQ